MKELNKLQKNSFSIKIPTFEGPLDLLLYLIKRNEIDIYDIPIAKITEQFLQYLDFMKTLAIENISEYILMAAYLIHLKTCMLLPKHNLLEEEGTQEEEDPRLPLVKQLLAYKELKKAIENIEKLYEQQKYIFFKEDETQNEQIISLEEISVSSLIISFFSLIKKKKQEIIYIPPITIRMEDKISEIIALLRKNKFLKLSTLIYDKQLSEIITYFIAILELIKRKKIKAFQDKEFSEIYFFNKKSANKIKLIKD